MTTKTTIPASSAGDVTSFGVIWREAWSIFKKSPWMLLAVFGIPTVVYAVLNIIYSVAPVLLLTGNIGDGSATTSMLMLGGLWIFLALLISILGFVSTFLASAGTVKAAKELDTTSKFSIGKMYKISLSKIWKALMLVLRTFVYTYAWLFLILVPIFIGVIAATQNESALQWVAAFFPLLFVVLAIFVVIRSLDLYFAFPIMYTQENVNSKEALQASIKLSKDRKGRIFVNMLLLGLIIIGIVFVYGLIAVILLGASFMTSMMQTTDVPASTLVTATIAQNLTFLPLTLATGCFAHVFHYAFLKKMREEKGE